jgi:hypothetical protein
MIYQIHGNIEEEKYDDYQNQYDDDQNEYDDDQYYLLNNKSYNYRVFIIFILLFIIFFVELYLTLNIGSNIYCNNSIISLKNWLLIKSGYTLLTFFLEFVFLFCIKKRFMSYIVSLYNILFNLTWLIFGSIIFWGYCKNLMNNINILIYSTLIIGYISIIIIYYINSSINNIRKKNKKTPLFHV